MASPTGGQFVFSIPPSTQQVILGINNGTAPVFPGPVTGDFNIEVFTSPTVTGVPAPDSGFQASVTDPNGTLSSNFLTGTVLTLGGGNYELTDSITGSASQSPARITLGSGNQTVVGANGDTLVGGSAAQILDALLGNETVIGGSGNESIWGGGAGVDSIVGGTGFNQQIVITTSGTTVVAGTGGNATISAASGDTINALVGNQNVAIAAGQNDLINLAGNTGTAGITGAAGDTITGNNATTGVDGSAGHMQIQVGGSGATTFVTGASSVAGTGGGAGGDTVLGSSGNLDYNPSSSAGLGNLINLSGTTGQATINAFSFTSGTSSTIVSAADTILGSNTADSVWGGNNDRIGTGNGSVVGGQHTWIHSDTTAGSAVAFGSNDTVTNSTTYDTVSGTATRGTVSGTSSAQVSVSNFNTTTDTVFYTGENATTDAEIRATAQNVGGNTTIILPDGTTMTFVGGINASLLRFTP